MREVADFDTDFENAEDTKGLYVRFYMHPVQNDALTLENGRPIYDDVEFIEIVVAGAPTNIVRRPVEETDKRRFAKSYSLFKAGDLEQNVGTPLSEIAWVTASQREELAYMRIRTVEQLADMPDAACTKIPGTYELKRKAADWIKRAANDAPFEIMRKENEDLKARLAALEESMASAKPDKGKK